MARGRSAQQLVTRWRDGGRQRGPDELVVEEPLSIHLDDVLVTTTMRTPGHDFELAAGFCFTEGLLAGAPIQTCRYCATGSAASTEFNVVTVETGGVAPPPSPRLTLTSSSCGLCGSASVDALAARLDPLPVTDPFPLPALRAIAGTVRAEQPLFDRTGGSHAAAAFDRTGRPVVVREDIGRHNAVDKVIGRLLLDGQLPATELGLFVSGRASFELAQKAWAAGFSALVAVSAPSALAVATAERGGLVLAGFARADGINVYCGAVDPEGQPADPRQRSATSVQD